MKILLNKKYKELIYENEQLEKLNQALKRDCYNKERNIDELNSLLSKFLNKISSKRVTMTYGEYTYNRYKPVTVTVNREFDKVECYFEK